MQYILLIVAKGVEGGGGGNLIHVKCKNPSVLVSYMYGVRCVCHL